MIDVKLFYPPHAHHGSYDLVVCAIGYEQRSRYASERLLLSGTKQLALAFRDRHVLAFSENLRWFESAGYECESVDDDDFRKLIQTAIQAIPASQEDVRIALDISSFNRVRIATAVHECRQVALQARKCTIDFYYSLAEFSPPSPPQGMNKHVGPVTPEFAGWTEDPLLPPHAVVGLGYEQGKALGALDHLEIVDAIAFIPKSPVDAYYSAVLEANADLLATISNEHAVRYSVHDPLQTFSMIESTVDGIRQTCNPVLLPFGPKIFFVTSLLTAIVHPECSVWRVSAGDSEAPANRIPSGHIISFRTTLAGS